MNLTRAFAHARGITLAVALALPVVGIGASAGHAQQPLPTVSLADLVERLMDAVVNVSTSQILTVDGGTPLPDNSPFRDLFDNNGNPIQQLQGAGSGFVVDPDGIIVTNFHVIEGADEIWANFQDGSRLRATIIGADQATDIAVLRVSPPRPLLAVSFGSSEDLRVGDWLMAIGSPFNLGGTVTTGILSARNRNLNAGPFDDYLQTDTAINQGNSGGPLFNMAGEVIGINTAIFSQSGASAGVAFAIPSEMASRVVSQIVEFGHIRRGRIGVRIQEVTDGLAEGFGIAQARGALVIQIFEGTPAEEVGLQVGDIILSLNGRSVLEMRDLPLYVAGTDVGTEVPITILRNGVEETLTIGIQEVDLAPGTIIAADGPETAPPPPIEPMTAEALGFTLEAISPSLRREYGLAPFINVGVVVTGVLPRSMAGERDIQPGEVILQVGADPADAVVATPEDVDARLAAAQEAGRRVALLLIADATGNTRFEWVRIAN